MIASLEQSPTNPPYAAEFLTSEERALAKRIDQLVIKGELQCSPLCTTALMRSKDKGLFPQPRWGLDTREPFIMVAVYSDESREACSTTHRTAAHGCKNLGWQGTWQDIHPTLGKFPCELPLRFFMNADGIYKQEGDKLHLLYEGHPVELTCTYRKELGSTSFEDAIALRVKSALEVKAMTQEDVMNARKSAIAMDPNKLVSPD